MINLGKEIESIRPNVLFGESQASAVIRNLIVHKIYHPLLNIQNMKYRITQEIEND